MRLLVVSTLCLCLAAVACGSGNRSSPADDPPVGDRLFVLGVPRSDHGTVNGVFLYTLDTDAGVLVKRNLPKLGIGDPEVFLDVTGGRLAYFGTYGATYSIDLELTETPKLLGGSRYFVPSGTAGRVWLRGGRTVHEVSVADGYVTAAADLPYPPCSWLVGAVKGALLCQARMDGMIAVNPRTDRTIARIPRTSFPLAVGERLVASCGEPCPRLRVTDPVAGHAFWIDPKPSFRWQAGYDGAFSPDGSLVAVPVAPKRRPVAGHPNALRVAIVDLASRSASPLADSQLRVDGPLAFSSTGDLYFVAPDGDVMRYEPATQSLTRIGSAGRIRVYDLTVS